MPLRKIQRVESFDFETTGLDPYRGSKTFTYIVGRRDGTTHRVRYEPGEFCNELQEYLLDTSIHKTVHNLKFELSFLSMEGYHVPEETVWHDTMIMSQILRNLHYDHSLDFLVWELGGDPDREYQQLEAKVKTMGRAYGGYQNVPDSLMKKYQEADAIRGMLLFDAFWPEIWKDPKQLEDYLNEIELIKVTQSMEQRGMMLDVEGAKRKVEECKRGLIEVEKDMEREFEGKDYFNLASPDDVARLLYDVYKMPVPAFTGTGKPAVNKDAIGVLRETHGDNKALEWVQKHRSYNKGQSIISGYMELMDEDCIIHPNIKTNFAVTGREACSNPNLQNVSKNQNQKNPYIVSARGCFRSRPGHVLLDIDQSGIELRLIIEAAGSEKMMDIMRSGGHPHIVACRMFYRERFRSKAEDKAMYDAGKNGHFCLCYGGGLPKFAATLNLSLAEAQTGYDEYYREFPEIAYLATEGSVKVRRTGYIRTPFGRKLRMPHGKHYAWLNYYIQGTAAGIIKRGQVKVFKYLRKRWPGKAWMILTVHDSIMIEFEEGVFNENQNEIYKDISALMTDIPEINVPLEVEWKLTRREWDGAKDFRPEGTKSQITRHRFRHRTKSRVASLR